MSFTFSLDELDKQVDVALKSTRRPANGLLPVGDTKKMYYGARITKIAGGHSSAKKTPQISFTYEITTPEWVLPNGMESTEDNPEAVWVGGKEVTETFYFTKGTLEKMLWKLFGLFAGVKDELKNIKGMTKEVNGKTQITLPVELSHELIGEWELKNFDKFSEWQQKVGSDLATALQPLIGKSLEVIVQHKKGEEKTRLAEDGFTEIKETPIYNSIAGTVPVQK